MQSMHTEPNLCSNVMRTNIHKHAHTKTYTHTPIYRHVCIFLHIFIYINIYKYIRIYIVETISKNSIATNVSVEEEDNFVFRHHGFDYGHSVP